MANYIDKWLQFTVDSVSGKHRNLVLPNGVPMPYGIYTFGETGSPATKAAWLRYYDNRGTIQSQLDRGLTDAERNSYMGDYNKAVANNYFIRDLYVPQWEKETQQQDAIQKQKDAIEAQKAEQERLRAEQEAKAREQQAALERQRQAAEKARKEAEFKSALDAMNQRANVKRTDEVVGEMSETPEQAAQRKKKRVGYDATKVTGILGAAPTESKKLLGM